MIPRTDLTDDRIAYLAPSVFASQPAEGVSDRYTFLPTSQILSRMRAEGWAPVEARQQAVRAEGRIGFQKHLLRFQRAELIAKAGEFTPELILTNSHDRSSAYVVAAGLWRFGKGGHPGMVCFSFVHRFFLLASSAAWFRIHS